MKIRNIEKWQTEVEHAMFHTFMYVDVTVEKIETPNGFTIYEPIKIEKSGKPWLTLDIECDGSIVAWNSEDWTIYRIMDVNTYNDKISMLCNLVQVVMSKDKYCTMF
jgi:hypothetical protein